ncbi:MAG: serine hydrolase [Bacteroidota bacterium]
MRLPVLLIIVCSLNSSFGQQNPVPGLPYVSPEKAGFDQNEIDHTINNIWAMPPGDFRGLVVIKDHELVIEEYFHTFWRISIHDIRSAGKSVTALLMGIAMKDGLIKDLDQDVYSLLPKEKYPTIHKDYQKITLRHLLNMTSGLDADTDRPETPGSAGNWIGLDDWKDYILGISLASEPGEHWVYADINPLLIATVIEEKSGMSLKDYAREKLFDPLGITQFYWYTNSANQTGAAGNLYLSTLDFAKIGVLVANEGKWKNEQIVDPNFVKDLITTKVKGVSDWWNLADSYGFFWYKSTRTFGGKTFEYLFASGNGGNQLIVIPEHEMVIALTSSAYGQRYAQRRTYDIINRVLSAFNR